MVVRKQVFLMAAAGAAILVLAAGGVAALTREPHDARVILAAPPPRSPRELTLIEAWRLANETATAWDGSWSAVALYSTDVNDTPGPDSGALGRRRTWQADFVDEAGNLRWLRLTDGVAVEAIEPGYSLQPSAGSDAPAPAIDSPELLAAALRERPALGPGTGKARGFHFVYGRDPSNGSWLASVVGEALAAPARVFLDPETGAFLRAERLTMRGGGLLASGDGGASWATSRLSGIVTAVAADTAGEESPRRVFAAAWSGDSLGLWTSIDAGESWTRAAVLPPRAGPAAHALLAGPWDGAESVLLASNSGIWVYRIPDASLSVIESGGPVLDLAVDGNGSLHAILMQAEDPDSARHYRWDASGSRWELMSQQRVTRFADGSQVAAFAETGDGQTILAESASGQFALRTTARGIESRVGAEERWELRQPGGVTSLAIAGDFDASGLALAVLYPGAVVRTADYGASWQRVTEVPGRFAEVFFAGRDLAFVTIPGSATWEGF
jgi:hypothetical protein